MSYDYYVNAGSDCCVTGITSHDFIEWFHGRGFVAVAACEFDVLTGLDYFDGEIQIYWKHPQTGAEGYFTMLDVDGDAVSASLDTDDSKLAIDFKMAWEEGE